MQLIAMPELKMSLDELDRILQGKAERKSELHDEMMQLEADITTILSIIAAKAIKELVAV
jgi:hypothetical protein